MLTYTNSITGVQEARDKLSKAMIKKYPSTKGSKYEVGIDPTNGKYAIVVFLTDQPLHKRIPPTVDGYRVIINGITPPFISPEATS